jgi:hypothetical protein
MLLQRGLAALIGWDKASNVNTEQLIKWRSYQFLNQRNWSIKRAQATILSELFWVQRNLHFGQIGLNIFPEDITRVTLVC